MIVQAYMEIRSLDLLQLASQSFPSVLEGLCVFDSMVNKADLKLRPGIAQQIQGFPRRRPLPPVADEGQAGADMLVAVDDGHASQDLVSVALGLMTDGYTVQADKFVDSLAVPSFDKGRMQSLIDAGAIVAQTTMFGESLFAVDAGAFAWQLSFVCGLPRRCMSIVPDHRAPEELTKLDLVAILLWQGLEPVSTAPEPSPIEGVTSFWSGALATVTKWYLCALYLREDIQKRGALTMHHRAPASFFEALCKSKNTLEVQLALECGTHNWSALMDEPTGDSLDLVDNPVLQQDLVRAPIGNGIVSLARLRSAQDLYRRPFTIPPQFVAEFAIIRFDGCSHKSGIPRGYVKCPWGHTACFRYQQLNVAGSRERLIANLVWWASEGEKRSRAEHQALAFDEARVAAIESQMFG